ncbi:kinase-like protein [Thozetella sp. PMI_491]|nr:kinase-like protein [Thozetella sp. PMI_491]
MQSAKVKAEALGRKAKLAHSYQELLDEFSNKDLKSVGNYTLGRLIGKGSFGKVYLATHKLTNGSKVVLKSANKDDSNLAREIHHHRQFVHPHIARLYEVIVTESMVWLVLEYCPGDELYNYLLKHGKLPVDKVQKTFTQLVGAVSYVHQQSCVHRDLKLENILLDKHENVKLCDFGFTREYEGKTNYLQTFCGTICYSAPEMLKAEKYAGEKVDVWSLGVILYALLCGELPFDDDDDSVTRSRILTEEPTYPDHIPADALSLMKSLLSKRPLLRPTLPEILAHPFLAEHAPHQQEILKLTRPAPFSTALEKETLQRMRSAGVDIDTVIESVLSQRCDALAGWWTLLLEKEERKARRRERKRKEKEAEHRNSRRFSQASSRLNALATVEEAFVRLSDPPPPRTRGRTERRSGHYPGLVVTDLPGLADLVKTANGNLSPDGEAPPPPIDKDSIRSASSSRHRRPIPPPKEGVLRSARSRGSTLHLVTTSDALGLSHGSQAGDPHKKVKKKPSQAIIAHWKNWTHWLFENTRRHKNSSKRASHSTPNLLDKPPGGKEGKSKDSSPRPQTSKYPTSGSATPASAGLPKGMVANGYAAKNTTSPATSGSAMQSPLTNLSTPSNPPHPPRIPSSNSYKRHSLSPSPLTPRSTVRRSSGNAGLRGRKSTSSSVSSIRSIHHHHHSHSKASSTSSNGSMSTSMSKTPLQTGRSPHHSVKVLPATPTSTSFPSNIRLVRDRSGPPLSIFNEGMPSYNERFGGPAVPSLPQPPSSPSPFGSFSPGGHGILFAKRKRNIFKGPMLSLGGGRENRGSSSGHGSASHSRSASASGLGRRSGEQPIQEVDEDAEEEEGEGDEEVEEVDTFSPIVQRPGEMVEEIYEDEEQEAPANATNATNADDHSQEQTKGKQPLQELQPAAPIEAAT